MEIRLATPEDASSILAVYAPYVRYTAVSFEYDVPAVTEFTERIKNTLKKYPYIVAVVDNKIVGYAYASAFHSRIAYEHWAEGSIYIQEEYHGMGIGKALYEELERILVKQGIYTVCACIAVPDGDDEHLTNNSEQFHTHMGYRTVGRHELCGYKFGKWYSIIWMEKKIAEKEDCPQHIIPFGEL